MSVFENIFFISASTFLAISEPSVSAKIEGPDPEMPQPKAPVLIDLDLTVSNSGINWLLSGSTTTSCNDRLIN